MFKFFFIYFTLKITFSLIYFLLLSETYISICFIYLCFYWSIIYIYNNSHFQWRCTCGNCVIMPSATECVCCKEIDKIQSLMEAKPMDLLKTVLHRTRGFTPLVLMFMYFKLDIRSTDNNTGKPFKIQQSKFTVIRTLVFTQINMCS